MIGGTDRQVRRAQTELKRRGHLTPITLGRRNVGATFWIVHVTPSLSGGQKCPADSGGHLRSLSAGQKCPLLQKTEQKAEIPEQKEDLMSLTRTL
jgi:hypothetical protein